MKRIILMVAKLCYIAPYWMYKLTHLGNNDKFDEGTRYTFLMKMITRINKAGRVTIDYSGQELLPKDNGYIMFPNHQGLFDVLAIIEAHERPFAVVVKKEASNLILLKQVVKLVKGQVIDRDDVRQAMQVIKNMTNEVKEGRNYLIFAEGTRSKKGNELLEFKGGSFKSAMNAQCPIVPVALIDSFKPFDENKIQKVTVKVQFLEPIYYEEYVGMKSTQIAVMVSDRIKAAIENKHN